MKERIEYHPFGTYRQRTDYDASFPNVNYTFTEQEDDDELGLYNYKARLYDPALGRFFSADAIIPKYDDPQNLNRYSYCLNNPLVYVDPTGNFSIGRFFRSLFTGFAAALTLFLRGGNLVLAGMVAGALDGACSGKLDNVIFGTVTGGISGGVGMGIVSILPNVGPILMLAGGAGTAFATGGADGLAYFGAGLAGGVAGTVAGSYLKQQGLFGPASVGKNSLPGTDYTTQNRNVADTMPIPDGVRRDLAPYCADPIPGGGVDFGKYTLHKGVPWLYRLFGAEGYISGTDVYWDPKSTLYDTPAFSGLIGHEVIGHGPQLEHYSFFRLRYAFAFVVDGCRATSNRFDIPAYTIGDMIREGSVRRAVGL
jgi:RHS repeat-associated protein